MTELQGVNDKIIVRLIIVKEKKTESGIILTGEAAQNQEPQKYGIVESFGNDVKFDIKKGDILLFHNRAGMDIIINKIIYKVLKDDEVYAKLINKEGNGDEKTN